MIAESPVARPRLASATGLSLATVSTLTGELLSLGLLAESGYEESAGGRPRALLTPDTRRGVLVGVDIAETYVHAEVYDLACTVLARTGERLHHDEREPSRVAERVAGAVRTAVAKAGTPEDRVLGTGISMPGVVDRAGGNAGYAATWGWHDVPLLELLRPRLPMPLFLDSPLHASALAELWFGAVRGREDAVVVNVGTGVGAGLVIGGEVHRGKDNAAGEWGHTPLVPDGRPCRCGNAGCVETYAGAPGIMQTLAELSPGSPMLYRADQTATIEALVHGLAHGNPAACETVRRTGRSLGSALAGLVNLLNPEVAVLGGWVATALGQPLLDEVRAVVARRALTHPFRGTEFALCPLTASPVCLGTAALALEGLLSVPARRSDHQRIPQGER